MKIKKRVNGEYINLEIKKIKKYKDFNLYQVYKIKKGKKIPMYKETYNKEQIQKIKNNKNIIEEEYICEK